jgi:hypothetical protein
MRQQLGLAVTAAIPLGCASLQQCRLLPLPLFPDQPPPDPHMPLSQHLDCQRSQGY